MDNFEEYEVIAGICLLHYYVLHQKVEAECKQISSPFHASFYIKLTLLSIYL